MYTINHDKKREKENRAINERKHGENVEAQSTW